MLQLVLVLRNAAASCLFIKDCCSCMSFYQGVLLVLLLLTRVVFFLAFYQELLFLLVLSSRIVVPTVPFSKACCCNLSARFAIHMVELDFSYLFFILGPSCPWQQGLFLESKLVLSTRTCVILSAQLRPQLQGFCFAQVVILQSLINCVDDLFCTVLT